VKIFIASSWRNEEFEAVANTVRARGHEVHDWKDPEHAFHWRDVNPDWEKWSSGQFISALNNDRCILASTADYDALSAADAGILLLPAGRSAHFEAGMMAGMRTPLCVLLDPNEPPSPELVYLNAEFTTDNLNEALGWLEQVEARRR
jgi:hypothetical protein